MVQVVILDFWGVIFNPRTSYSSGETTQGLAIFLQACKERNINLGIASSSSQKFITEFLTEHDLLDFFPVIVGIDEVTRTKPDPECYIKVAEYFQVKPEHCIVLDDSPLPLMYAREAGFITKLFGDDLGDDSGTSVRTFDDDTLDTLLS